MRTEKVSLEYNVEMRLWRIVGGKYIWCPKSVGEKLQGTE